jgi:hypothetical protein
MREIPCCYGVDGEAGMIELSSAERREVGGRGNHPDDDITLSKPGLELSRRELGSIKLTNVQEEE